MQIQSSFSFLYAQVTVKLIAFSWCRCQRGQTKVSENIFLFLSYGITFAIKRKTTHIARHSVGCFIVCYTVLLPQLFSQTNTKLSHTSLTLNIV